jgi:hypothetical protein
LRQKFNVKPLSEWGKKCYIQWLLDINNTIDIFYKLIYSDYTLYDLMLKEMFDRLIDSFEIFNGICLQEETIDKVIYDKHIDIDELRAKLLNWLNNEYHPKVLFEDFVHTIKIFRYGGKVKQFESFEKIRMFIYYTVKLKDLLCLKRLETINHHVEFGNEEMLLRFYDFISHFKSQLGI